jgi:tryptophan synthase alpha chain
MTSQTTGLARISGTFEKSRLKGAAALMPYFTLGFPDAATSVEIIEAIARSGADMIELGVPFSDPLADGPTIQHSAQIALEQGITLQRCLELTDELRTRGVKQPFLLMGYVNPILTYGVNRFVEDSVSNGVDGLIVPDLPPDEAEELDIACRKTELGLAYLLAPTSTEERIRLIVERSRGFVYLVSVNGVTGARSDLPINLEEFVYRVRGYTKKPLAVGFGISTSDQGKRVSRLADGVIIGSALINAVEKGNDPARSAADFVIGIRSALD